MSTLGPDIGAALALRHLEAAAKDAQPNEPLLVTIQRARNTLWREIERTAPATASDWRRDD